MSEPAKNMMNEVLSKLRYDPGSLSAEERRLIAADSELARELELNKVLDASGFGDPAAPEVGTQISAAISSSEDDENTREEEGTMRSWLVGKKWYWQAAVAAAVLVVLALAALLPWRVAVTPDGLGVDNHAAWATVDGYVLEFKATCEEVYTGTAEDSADHPLWQVRSAVDAWARDNADRLDAATGQSPVEFKIEHGQARPKDKVVYADGSGKEFVYNIQVTVLTTDRSLVDRLSEELADFEEVSASRAFSHQWFYCEKFPELRYEGREVIVNGQTLAYPQDVNEDSLSLMDFLLNVMPNEDGWVYLALDDTEEFKRVGLDDIVRISWEDDGRINIENTTYELDFNDLGLPSWVHWMMMYVPAGETHLELDIVDLLRKNAVGQQKPIVNEFRAKGQLVVVDLVPREIWLGKTEQELKKSAGLLSLNQLNKKITELESALAKLYRDHPDATTLLSTKPVMLGDIPVQWVMYTTGRYQAALAQLAKEYCARPGQPASIVPDLTQIGFIGDGDIARVVIHDSGIMNWNDANLYIQLIDTQDEHGNDTHLGVKRASEAEKQQAAVDAQRLRDAVTEWIAENDDNLIVTPDVHVWETLDVPVSAMVQFNRDCEAVDELAAELKAAGFADVRISRQQPQLSPTGLYLTVRLLEPEQLRGIDAEDVDREILGELFEQSKRSQAILAKVLDDFKSDHLAGEPGSDAAVQLNTYNRDYGDLAVCTYIRTNQAPGAVIDDLVVRLAQAGFSAPVIGEPYGYDAGKLSLETQRKWAARVSDHETCVLQYFLPHYDRVFAWPAEDVDMLFTEDERDATEDLYHRMQAALENWLVGQPEDVEVTLDTNIQGGVIQHISANSNKHDEETVLALAEALEIEGVPVYQYGTAFLNRHASWRNGETPEMVEVQVTHVGWPLLPQVRSSAAFGSEDYIAALHEEFSEEEIEQAWKECRKIKQAFHDWLELHPELKDEVDDANCVGMLKASVSENIHGDVITLLIIVLHTGDAAREQELAEELMELAAEAGVEIKPYTGRHPMFLPCIASEE